eukprot:3451472-Amphidinium_carterae.1
MCHDMIQDSSDPPCVMRNEAKNRRRQPLHSKLEWAPKLLELSVRSRRLTCAFLVELHRSQLSWIGHPSCVGTNAGFRGRTLLPGQAWPLHSRTEHLSTIVVSIGSST